MLPVFSMCGVRVCGCILCSTDVSCRTFLKISGSPGDVLAAQRGFKLCQVRSGHCQKGCFNASTEQRKKKKTVLYYSSYARHHVYVPNLHRVRQFSEIWMLLYTCNVQLQYKLCLFECRELSSNQGDNHSSQIPKKYPSLKGISALPGNPLPPFVSMGAEAVMLFACYCGTFIPWSGCLKE